MVFTAVPVLVLIAFTSVEVSSDKLDLNFDYYCADELQCVGQFGLIRNTLCNTTLKFAPNCIDAKYVPVTDELKQLILDGHNKLRNEQALGKTGYIFDNKTVADMATVSWDDELELMSLSNALNCKMEHDGCRHTAKYKTVGQNLGAGCEQWPGVTSIEEIIQVTMQKWYDEYTILPSLEEVDSLGSSQMNGFGHWTQLVQSKADRIGCSLVQYRFQTHFKCTMLVCNYNAGNLVPYPIFTFGAPASLCKMGANTKYPGLCNPNEDFSQHVNGKDYFNENAPESPVVEKWLENGKQLNI